MLLKGAIWTCSEAILENPRILYEFYLVIQTPEMNISLEIYIYIITITSAL